MKASVLGIALAAVLLFPNANGQEMTQLSCKDFVPTEEARQRFPDLAGACDGVVERDGELFGLPKYAGYAAAGLRCTCRRPIIRLPSSRIPRYVY
jgi:hypothetical protein